MAKRSKKKSDTWKLIVSIFFAIGGLGNIGTSWGAAIFGIVVAAAFGFWWWKSRAVPKRGTVSAAASAGASSFEAVGVYHYLDALRSVGEKSRSFDYPDDRFLTAYPDGKKIYEYYFQNVMGFLAPEPSNPHDKNAIQVMLGGVRVGYVPADLCLDVAALLEQGYHADVKVRGGDCRFVKNGKVYREEGDFHVYVDMRN